MSGELLTRDTRRFDFAEGREKGVQGKALAASRRRYVLRYARSLAVRMAIQQPDSRITADEVYAEMVRREIDVALLGNAAGSLFRGKWWRWTGDRRRPKRVSNHGRWIMVWRYQHDG